MTLEMQRLLRHTTLWIVVLAFWVFTSRDHHPTWLLNWIATTVLVGASAAAIYVDALVLRRQPPLLRALELVGVVAGLDVAAVLVIRTAYDLLWGPDPARYGFWTNVGLEAAFIGVHLGVASAVMWATRRTAGSRDTTAEETL